MPAMSPAAAPCRSASAIVAGAVTGDHVFKIVGYSLTKDVPNGMGIKSCPFQMGGRTWHAEYRPNGSNFDNADSISLYLVLADEVAEAVKISLLDQDGAPVPSHSFTTEVVNFSKKRQRGYPKFIQREVLEKSEHLRNDSFAVRFDVTVMKGVRTEDQAPVVVVPPSDMHQHLGDLLSRQLGVDVKLRVGRKTFLAHRAVLAARSPVFKANLYAPTKEKTSIIDIVDVEADVFHDLLTFIYTDTLLETEEREASTMAQRLLVAADRYNMERLKLICEDRLRKHIDRGSAATILALAVQHNCPDLKAACFEFLSTSTTLRLFPVEGFIQRFPRLPHHPGYVFC
ncbi:hypothetical protein ACP70R_019290 [Stipagrostis hirtigluma subsp. patula]